MFCYLCEKQHSPDQMIRAFRDSEFRQFCPSCYTLIKDDKERESYGKIAKYAGKL